MENESVLERTKARISEVLATRDQTLANIAERVAEAQEELATVTAREQIAAERMDAKAYIKAKDERAQIEMTLGMLADRKKQLAIDSCISEEESDRVIDDLLAYEDDLAEKYKVSVAEVLAQLERLNKDYAAAVLDAEQTIDLWTRKIHKNYRSKTASTIVNGQRTNRMPTPVPIRDIRYSGCRESKEVAEFLASMARAGVVRAENGQEGA